MFHILCESTWTTISFKMYWSFNYFIISITHSYEILGYKGKNNSLIYVQNRELYIAPFDIIDLEDFFNFFFLSYQLPFFLISSCLQLFFSLSHPLSYPKLDTIDDKNLIVNIHLNTLVILSGMSDHFLSPISNEW